MKQHDAEIICTLGPASMNARTIRRMADAGATLLREIVERGRY